MLSFIIRKPYGGQTDLSTDRQTDGPTGPSHYFGGRNPQPLGGGIFAAEKKHCNIIFNEDWAINTNSRQKVITKVHNKLNVLRTLEEARSTEDHPFHPCLPTPRLGAIDKKKRKKLTILST
ncbi:hypothetical protein DPMN_173067 [Dreissena polymorpha]|uniref:Uncharacterized protein n=1 Tax=Dreissena polymorpha TaxID=45954 RepID=A0A9D4IDW0_DREPO|nr:hypothetical protein DPMN_173067 [Dreissena polymorpha]